MVREFEHIGMPYCYRCAFDCTDGCRNCGRQYAAELERAVGMANGEAAGFIFEPMSGATLGAVAPPVGYLENIAEICRRQGVLLIADEVMTGMGRTGRNFAVEHWEVAPDILVTAKGLSSGYAPLGAVIASKKVVDAIAVGSEGGQGPHRGSGAFLHGLTYNAHPVSVAAGRAVLRRVQSLNLVHAADSNTEGTAGFALKNALEGLRDLDCVGDVRGLGMLWAVEFVSDKKTNAPFPPEKNFAGLVGQACLRRGLLVYPMQGCVDGVAGDHVLVAPPAVITAEQIGWAVEQLRAAVKEST
jgi:adenosylmethionine-8-amino-7-oxononanoate aminotransferase